MEKVMDPQGLLRAYRLMFAIRTFEERVEKEFAGGNIPGFAHTYIGQEASGVGVCFDLTDEDHIGSTHRGHGHCIAKGCDIRGMMHEIMGRADGLCGGKGGSMHIADLSKGMLGANAIVGGSAPIAVGAALRHKTLKSGNVAVAFSGDGASNQGTVFEAMNLAVVLKVPAIFAFENNEYGEHTHYSYAVGSGDIAQRAIAFGLPTEVVDGHDFFAVRAAMQRALARARQGEGPTALEIRTLRVKGHFIGDPQAYRTPQDTARALDNDPLQVFRDRVTADGSLSAAQLDAVEQSVREEVESAVQSALAAPLPALSSLTKDVYVRY
jgi:pyruvate dehydrogenase E1 component alpha subunit